jgi:hypothetical protein
MLLSAGPILLRAVIKEDEDGGRVLEHLEHLRDECGVWLEYKSALYADNPLLNEGEM